MLIEKCFLRVNKGYKGLSVLYLFKPVTWHARALHIL